MKNLNTFEEFLNENTQMLKLSDRVKIIDTESPFYDIIGKIQAIASKDNPRVEGRYIVALNEFPKDMKFKAFRSSIRSFNIEQLEKI